MELLMKYDGWIFNCMILDWISVINNLKGYCLVFFVKFIVRFEMIEENDI